jgi:site-specific DNA-methyltransferase (cytosine-N4-specific)
MSVYYQDETVTLHHGDALDVARAMPSGSVDCIVTSPPYYGLRDYGAEGQYGNEETLPDYIETMRALFAELRRVLADDGTFWLNLGDSYSGSWGNQGRKAERGTQRAVNKPMMQKVHDGRYPDAGTKTGSIRPGQPPAKNLMGVPWRVAFALQDDGWILRNSIIWAKPNAMPESIQDRLSTKHENLFMFSKSPRYWFDLDPIREPVQENNHTGHVFGRAKKAQALQTGSSARRTGGIYEPTGKGKNPGDVWTIPTQPYPGAHFAVFPQELPRRCIVAGCKPGGTVLDPFNGSGTTGLVAQNNGRKYVGIDINAEYLDLTLKTRLWHGVLDLGAEA